jgi:exodeoxyribonuclease V alpha subunit
VEARSGQKVIRDIRGIGFITADTLAHKLGIEKTAAIRARAGIAYALMKAVDEGQCGLPREELREVRRCSKLGEWLAAPGR